MQPFFSKRRLILLALVLSGLAITGKLAIVLRAHRASTVPASNTQPQQQKAVQDFLTKKAKIASLKAQLTVFENILVQYPDNSEARKRASEIHMKITELEPASPQQVQEGIQGLLQKKADLQTNKTQLAIQEKLLESFPESQEIQQRIRDLRKAIQDAQAP